MELDFKTVINETQKAVEDNNITTDEQWTKYCNDLKVKQAFKKLEELGYYHDSGLYGWIPKEK